MIYEYEAIQKILPFVKIAIANSATQSRRLDKRLASANFKLLKLQLYNDSGEIFKWTSFHSLNVK